MFLFQTSAQAGSKTQNMAGAQANASSSNDSYYSQVSKSIPVGNIRESYDNLTSEYKKIGGYDKAVTVGFFAWWMGIGGSKKNCKRLMERGKNRPF